MRRAREAVGTPNGEGASAAAAEHQSRKQGLRPMGAVQAVLPVVLADTLGDIGVFGRGDGLPRLHRLPEFVADDA
ncbi:hypothetical protein IB024_06280 [Brucella sp. 6810]|uniref:hypothetical protein n=1 Tax=Brucella sp. 6810 TaxID=2769351 RepID=UPI00165A4B0A|nr:hypothetical protein [Brucella sp. 6810]QNQ63347.1 hypothetical protein IB024_06280 [Brucella sp. 6810]